MSQLPSRHDFLGALVRALEKSDHKLSLREWTAILLEYNRRLFAERPAPVAALPFMTAAARVCQLRKRLKRREALRHKGDVKNSSQLAVALIDGLETLVVQASALRVPAGISLALVKATRELATLDGQPRLLIRSPCGRLYSVAVAGIAAEQVALAVYRVEPEDPCPK
jgi:glutaredoxin 2